MNAEHPNDKVPATLVDLLKWRARKTSQEIVFIFVASDGAEVTVTYADLDQRAQMVASALRGVSEPGDRALLLLPTGLDYVAAFFGCLYAGVVAVPAYPPRTNQGLARLQAIAADAEPAVVLSSRVQASLQQRLAREAPGLAGCSFISPDDLVDGPEQDSLASSVTADTLAYLQYTSGSTASPKGVMLTHANVLHNADVIHKSFGMNEHSRGVMWLPPYHDMGLVGGLVEPVYGGVPCVLMSPMTFVQHPVRWLEAISRFRATVSGGPDFAYALCARKVTPAERTTLDLSSWEVAFTGGESIRASTLELFSQAFSAYGFRREAFHPCYGLAEATLLVSGGEVGTPPHVAWVSVAHLERGEVKVCAPSDAGTRAIVSSGQCQVDQAVAIVDPVSREPCGRNRVGEIWLSAPSIAIGYWDRPDETSRTFSAYCADSGAGPFLRTGDLGFLLNRELFVAGRLKDLIIISGRNHYPEDIEPTVEHSHPALQPCGGAAFSVDIANQERLVIVTELRREHRSADVEEVASAVRLAVAQQHELPVSAVVLLKPGTIPKTSSGKIQRQTCRERFLAGTLEIVGVRALDEQVLIEEPSADELNIAGAESVIMTTFANALGFQHVDVNANFFAIGGDSLAGVLLVAELSARLNIDISPADLATAPSARSLARRIATRSTPRAREQTAATLPAGKTEERIGTPARTQTACWSPIVRLHPTGTKRTFYCVHPGTGTASVYAHISHRLDPNRPFSALQAPGVWDDQSPLTEITSMAHLYLQTMRAEDQNEPYSLGGYCTGGIIAFEMAQQLQRAGHAVAALILFDTWAPGPYKVGYDSADELARLISDFAPISSTDLRGLSFEAQLDQVVNASAKAGRLPVQMELDKAKRFIRAALLIERARQRYNARDYRGELCLIRSNDRRVDREDDGAMGWGHLVGGRIEVQTINCDHVRLVEPENTDVLIGLIRPILDAADRVHGQ